VTRVKICGLTAVDQAVACVDLGADAIGINFVPSSVRRIDLATGRAIVRAVGSRALVVAVVANESVEAMRAVLEASGAGCLQLHGDEPADDVAALLPHAYKAVRVATSDDVAVAESMPGDYVLVDAKAENMLGGTGRLLDWSLVASLATRRRLVLAGGLTPDNVAGAVAAVHPWCVDVASGVESAVGIKDRGRVEAFIRNARGA
jgi:phosphoribosylanthranilate isomerase